MKESLTEWWGSFAACTLEIVGIFFGRYGLGSQRVLAKETSKGLKGF